MTSKAPDASLLGMFSSMARNRFLVTQMIRREVSGRYKGSWLGLAWSFFNPVVMLTIYTFFFSVIFKARWGLGQEESTGSFAIILFVGLILHGLFAECVNRAPTLVLGNVNYVKRVVFPLEALPMVSLGSALFHAVVSIVVLLIAQLMIGMGVKWTIIFLPLALAPLALSALGVSWMLSSLGVYIRDVAQITNFVTAILLFLSPVFYPISSVPPPFRSWLMLNPLTFIIEQARAVVIFGRLPDFFGLFIAFLVSLILCWMGFWWFQRTRKGFADAL